ncbi:uncharacterized protein A4U43_C01F13270 [Asparagus officinalis]|uniref:Uncharacterized protein n=1 Tax=Asparagus officinalis TaxID=4686 RepID=A0A5P1FTK8_ASPOF|nr:uncharacterized protein A4U43_C01F13270 [Asparagus officinalis]
MQALASAHDFPSSLKYKRGVDVGATVEREAKRAHGTTVVIVLVPSDGGEEEEELLDYLGKDDLSFRCSPDINSPAEDLEIPSSLPAQTMWRDFRCWGEWSSLVGATHARALSSSQLHAIEQVNPLVVVATPTGAEEEVLAHEKMPSQEEEVPVQQGAHIPKEKVPIQGEVLNQGEEASTQEEEPVEEEVLIHEASIQEKTRLPHSRAA